jgi:hypothetical protein
MKTPEFLKIIAHRGHLTNLPENAVGYIRKVLKFTPEETRKGCSESSSSRNRKSVVAARFSIKSS